MIGEVRSTVEASVPPATEARDPNVQAGHSASAGKAAGLRTSQAIQETRQRFETDLLSRDGRLWDGPLPFLFTDEQPKVAKPLAEQLGPLENWFLIGDVHGDYYAFKNAVEHIRLVCPDFRLMLLGDIIDRGPHPVECIAFLFELALSHPGRIAWIAGNHDVGLAYDDSAGRFRSSVSPSEFADALNAQTLSAPLSCQAARQFIDVVNQLPRAVLFPDGLLITHGGIPHTDLQLKLASLPVDQRAEWLNSEDVLDDFTWTRISRYRKKIPNRASHGCEYGYGDFDSLCREAADILPAARLVTGHDHPAGGFDRHADWVGREALTLTGFAFDQNYDEREAFTSRYQSDLVFGRCRMGCIPEVIRVPVYADDLQAFFDLEIDRRMPMSPGSQ